jgi:phosphate starvation-inducible PhoH-like protein
MGSTKKVKSRLSEKQASLVKNFQPKTEKQSALVHLIENKEITIVTGIAGSGKTFVSLATALSLLGPVYKRIIIAKSVTTLPKEEIGFLKGGLEQKMEPFMMSFMWNLEKICGKDSAKELIDKELIMVLPLAFIRGLSIDNAIIIVDEVQNIDPHTFKTLITRIGENSKYIFLGDVEQIDMKKKEDSCLQLVVDIFKDSDIVGTINFEDEDCVRNPIIPKILEKLRERGI